MGKFWYGMEGMVRFVWEVFVGNIVRARVVIQGTRTMLQHHFGPEAIPLEKAEKSGVAGNNPEEWRATSLVDSEGTLYVLGTYVFGCLRNGAIHTKRGRGTLQAPLVSTLQVEEDIVKLNRSMPSGDITHQSILNPVDPEIMVFVYVSSVKNPATKGRNVRYRLATRSGWRCKFTLQWDKTIISREQMKAVLRDSGTFGGIGDGIKIGCGRFEVLTYKELDSAEEKTTKRNMDDNSGNGVDTGRRKMRSVQRESSSE